MKICEQLDSATDGLARHRPTSFTSIAPRGFPDSSVGKESACNAGLIPGLGRSPGEGNGYPLHYSGLENSMDCIVHGEAELDRTERLLLFTAPQIRQVL